MSWKDLYNKRLATAEEAVKRIKSGDRVVLGHATGEPQVLVDAMVKNAAAYKNVEIIHMVPMGPAKYCLPEYRDNFRHNSLFSGGNTRKAIKAGIADFTPIYFHEVPAILSGSLKPDVALVQVTAPDNNGYCSLGVSVDYTKPAVENAALVIAQVNPNMPRTFGDSFVHVSEIDVFVETDVPILELPRAELGDVEKAIGENCGSLIPDGATLQLGIGTIPDAVLLSLKDKKDLGIHTEMFSDGAVELMEAGIINNKRKTLHPGKSVASFLMGTRYLYDYVDNNPSVMMLPVDYVNDPYVIRQNDNLISINSCVQVDLQGQVVSTSIGKDEISGVGGQVDFVRGANMSKGGKSIIAISSTAGGGKISKIVPFISEGSSVTTSRHDVGYIVTEYGVAELRGKTLRDRAKALISIAHPDFKDELQEEFERRFP